MAVRSSAARGAVGLVAALLVGAAFWLDRPAGEPAATAGPTISVVDAYVREPAVDDVAAAYFTVRNNGGRGDTLLSVTSDVAEQVGIHDLPGMSGHGEHRAARSMPVPPGQTVSLSPGQGHVMLERPLAPLEPGQSVTLVLTFVESGELSVAAPVIAIGVEPPGGRR